MVSEGQLQHGAGVGGVCGTLLSELLADHQLYHSEFQMDHFITIRSGGTPYGCYKQALREIHKRDRGLRDLQNARERLVVDIEELESRGWLRSRFTKRRDAINLREKREQLADLDRNIADTERELRRFVEQATDLREQIGTLTSEKRAALDREMWAHKIKCMAAVDFLARGRLDARTIELLVSVPSEMRRRLMAEIVGTDETHQETHAALIHWFHSQEPMQPQPCLCAADS